MAHLSARIFGVFALMLITTSGAPIIDETKTPTVRVEDPIYMPQLMQNPQDSGLYNPFAVSYPWPGVVFVQEPEDPFRLKRPNRRPGKRPGSGFFQGPIYPNKKPNFSDKHPDYDLFLLALRDQSFQSFDFDLLE